MLASLLPLLLAQTTSTPDVLSLWERRWESARAFRLSADVVSNEWPGAVQMDWIGRDRQDQVIQIQGLGEMYRGVQIGSKVLEMDMIRQKSHEESGVEGRSVPAPYVHALASRAYPAWMQGRQIRQSLGENANRPASPSTSAPESGWIRYSEGTPDDSQAQYWFSADGTLRKARFDLMTQDGPSHMEYRFGSFEWNPRLNDSAFVFRVPLGFAPMFSESPRVPLPIFSPIPRGPWVSAEGRRLSGMMLINRKPMLVVVTQADCAGSARLRAELTRFVTVLKRVEGKVVELQLGPAAASPRAVPEVTIFRDADGLLERSLQVPGTPMMYLFNASGQVNGLWYGGPPQKARQLAEEVQFMLENPPLSDPT